jgi:hypothetical protein
MLRLPHLQTGMMMFTFCPFHPALLSCDSENEVVIQHSVLMSPLHIPLFAVTLPRRLVADALSGMVNIDLLLLL